MITVHWKRYGGNSIGFSTSACGAERHHRCAYIPHHHHSGTFLRTDRRLREMFRIRMADWASGAASCLERLPLGHGVVWHYPMALLGDAVAPGLLNGAGRGTSGQLVQLRLYGAPTTLPWGLKLNMERKRHRSQRRQCYDGATCPTGTLFHPTFLYDDLNLIGAALIVFLGSVIMKTQAGPCSPYTSCGGGRT